MECQQTFHAQRRCWLQRVFSAFHYGCCTLGALDSIGCVVSFCCLLQERVDNIRSHLRAGSGKNRATIKPLGRCRSCGGERERLGRERQDPPTRWRRCRSDDPPQGIPRGPKSNVKQQRMRLVDKFFVNLETEVGRLFL